MKRAILLLVFNIMLCGMSSADVPAKADAGDFMLLSHPKHEVRAVWLTTIGGLDWPRTYARTPEGVRRQKEEIGRAHV